MELRRAFPRTSRLLSLSPFADETYAFVEALMSLNAKDPGEKQRQPISLKVVPSAHIESL
jgi:hypothetical protein